MYGNKTRGLFLIGWYQLRCMQLALINTFVFKNRPGCLFIRTFFTEEFLYPLAWNCMYPPFNNFNMWDQDTPDVMEISSYPCNYIYIYNKSH